jgi:hypothetical protein
MSEFLTQKGIMFAFLMVKEFTVNGVYKVIPCFLIRSYMVGLVVSSNLAAKEILLPVIARAWRIQFCSARLRASWSV